MTGEEQQGAGNGTGTGTGTVAVEGVGQVPDTGTQQPQVIYSGPSAERVEAVRRAVSVETARVQKAFTTPFNGPER